jgi:hypothetical protein
MTTVELQRDEDMELRFSGVKAVRSHRKCKGDWRAAEKVRDKHETLKSGLWWYSDCSINEKQTLFTPK